MSVRLRGFMSYREPQELCFDDDRLWVLEGPNGVGKSTIFDGITFALFGQHRLGKQHHQDLINHDSDGMEVDFVLRLSDQEFKLSRTVPKKGHPTCQIRKRAENGHFVPVAGTEQRCGYEAWVQEHLGLDYEAFTSSVLLLQGESEKLIQCKPIERRKLLAQLIDLSRYERLHQAAKKRADDHGKEAASLKRRLEALHEIQDADIVAAAAALSETEDARATLDREVEQLCELLPDAVRREQLLAEQAEVSGREALEQQIVARALEIRMQAAELARLTPLLEPLRQVGAARQALRDANAAVSDDDAGTARIETEERAAADADDAARRRVIELEGSEEAARRRLEDLGDERAHLLPIQARWNAAEEMRRQQQERTARLAQVPLIDEEAAKQAHDAARKVFKERQMEASHARAEHHQVAARLAKLEELTSRMVDEAIPCSLCGQPVTLAHAETERTRLTATCNRLAVAESTANAALADAESALSRMQRALHEAVALVEKRCALQEQHAQGALALERHLQELTEDEARSAVQRLVELEPLLAEANQVFDDQKQALRDARKEAADAGARRRKTDGARRAHERSLEAARARQQQSFGKLEALLGRLPEDLRDALPEHVTSIENRAVELEPYRDLLAQLERAEAGDAGRRLVEIARLLDEVPAAARHPVADLTRERDEKRAARDLAKRRRDQQAADLARLQADGRARAETEAQREAAAREEHLYGLLAKLLGPEELQRRLVRDAEQAIVQHANRELDGFTQGRLQLALRPGKDGEDAAQKALDLLVHDHETGGADNPTALDLASGSQKFRIAISLALAIGRYLAGETRRVESVIIDEGFGCLDRAGREDAVAVLREISEQSLNVKRVILVSHQEEFSGRFKSGYRIDLVDRTSVPVRVTR